MVQLTVTIEQEKRDLYMDDGLHGQLKKNVKPKVQKKDMDYVLILDGEEGAGKSVFAFQIAKVLDPNFSVDNICFTPNEFIKKVLKAKPHSCIVFDEAFTGLSSRSALSEVNRLLVSLMMEMRQKNLFVILVMPSFFMLDKYAVLHRARSLIHIYMRGNRRGYWKLYTKRRMKDLYLKGKKYYEYGGVTHYMFGRFFNQYTIDEEKYRAVKRLSFNKKRRSTRAEAYKEQRDTLFYIMFKEMELSQTKISILSRKYGYRVAQNTISEIIRDKQRFYLTDDSD